METLFSYTFSDVRLSRLLPTIFLLSKTNDVIYNIEVSKQCLLSEAPFLKFYNFFCHNSYECNTLKASEMRLFENVQRYPSV